MDAMNLDRLYLANRNAYLTAVNGESPRGKVFFAANILHDQLATCLKAFLIEDAVANGLTDDPRGPLATFSARASLAYALGLISKEEYEDCDTIGRIRDEFSKSLKADFETEEIRDLCQDLRCGLEATGGITPLAAPHGMNKFVTTAVSLISRFSVRHHYISRKRATYSGWPY